MRSFVLSTYTLKPYGIHPSLFKSRVFSFFRFSVSFCFLSRAAAYSDPSRVERNGERERETKKKLPFFHSFWRRQTRTYRMQKKSYNSWLEKTPREISSRSDHEKTALCDCILSMYSFIEESSFRALSLSLLSSHHHTQY